MRVIEQALDLKEGHVREKVHHCERNDEDDDYNRFENVEVPWTLVQTEKSESETTNCFQTERQLKLVLSHFTYHLCECFLARLLFK